MPMRALLDRLVNPLHLLIALGCTWLAITSPWLGMYHALPEPPGALNLSHVIIGLALLPFGLVYFAACTLGGRWPLYFPWAAGQFDAIGSDLAGLFKGQRPGSEAGGLFATIEGLLLLALLATLFTGALWWLVRGTDAAAGWRSAHIPCARTFIGLMGLHVVAVALHLIDLVRD
ncbi:MAG TPA: cytochrome b/b6 domain-containing protein [Burkholderiaceae bacterium]|nr:cytochrome b/b6 domain-containing protein [Burkholderiaceae bacterium]HQR71443.1 cytochrome b/b6 domain-containing protein [Burkholderiaceae bacterium]